MRPNERCRAALPVLLAGIVAACHGPADDASSSNPQDAAADSELPVVTGVAGAAITRGGEAPDDEAAHLARMKRVIRQDIEIAYGDLCGGIAVPDAAFEPVELTGGGLPELAVPMGRVACARGATLFSGSGGDRVQFWIGSGGPVRLLLEQTMMAFTPGDAMLTTIEHGARCPDGAGPTGCFTVYRWDDRTRRLELESRRLATDLPMPPQMQYDYEWIANGAQAASE